MKIDYTFVPQSVGDFHIGADKFVYFNPESRKYVTLTTPTYDIKVARGAAVSAAADVNKQSISSKNTDILHIKMGDLHPAKVHRYFYSSAWYWPAYIVLALILVAIIWIYSKKVKAQRRHSGPSARQRQQSRQKATQDCQRDSCRLMTTTSSTRRCSVLYGAI